MYHKQLFLMSLLLYFQYYRYDTNFHIVSGLNVFFMVSSLILWSHQAFLIVFAMSGLSVLLSLWFLSLDRIEKTIPFLGYSAKYLINSQMRWLQWAQTCLVPVVVLLLVTHTFDFTPSVLKGLCESLIVIIPATMMVSGIVIGTSSQTKL